MNRADEAVRLFREGYACSQAVLIAFRGDAGLSRDQAARVGAGFGAGMRTGEVCGAASGAIAALGLAYCDHGCAMGSDRQAVNSAVVTFLTEFAERMGSSVCRDILGCDLGTPEGMTQATSKGLFDTVCVEAVEASALILEDMLGSS